MEATNNTAPTTEFVPYLEDTGSWMPTDPLGAMLYRIAKESGVGIETSKVRYTSFGATTLFHDENGEALFTGDVVAVARREEPENILGNVFVLEVHDKQFVDGMALGCDMETGELDTDFIVTKVLSYTDVPDRAEYHGTVLYRTPNDEPKDKAAVEASYTTTETEPFIRDVGARGRKNDVLSYLGKETPYHDENGAPLLTGDVVAVDLRENGASYGEAFVVWPESAEPFIDGIRCGCDADTGSVDSLWTITKKQGYADVPDGYTCDYAAMCRPAAK